jgi:hypothetical protein
MRRQTLKQMISQIKTGRAVNVARALSSLEGCPDGGWAETDQAMRRLVDELPRRAERSYTLAELVTATCSVDEATGRYRREA